MSLTTFTTGLSGLNTNSQGLNVVGNNIANLNTIGFKASSISFAEVLGQLGSRVSDVKATFGQGGVQGSSDPLDVAIQGKGFLIVSEEGSRYYTRGGNLHLDAQGNLLSENGMQVQGFMRDGTTGLINEDAGIQNITIPTGLTAPVPTSQFELGMNLDADAATGAQFSTTVQVYDSQGKVHNATLSMEKEIDASSTIRWRFDLTIPRNEIAGVAASNTEKFSLLTGAVATATPTAGALVFNNAGKLTSAYVGSDPATLPALGNLTLPPSSVTMPALANGAVLSPMTWKLMNSNGVPNVTGLASSSEMSSIIQNGAAPGSMSSIAIQSDGTIEGVFSNGKTLKLARLGLAQFNYPEGLTAQGEGLYAENSISGASRIAGPGDSGLGTVMGSTLELSNVDLASELTRIITFQRGYQANARVITTTDQIMQETLSLMR